MAKNEVRSGWARGEGMQAETEKMGRRLRDSCPCWKGLNSSNQAIGRLA